MNTTFTIVELWRLIENTASLNLRDLEHGYGNEDNFYKNLRQLYLSSGSVAARIVVVCDKFHFDRFMRIFLKTHSENLLAKFEANPNLAVNDNFNPHQLPLFILRILCRKFGLVVFIATVEPKRDVLRHLMDNNSSSGGGGGGGCGDGDDDMADNDDDSQMDDKDEWEEFLTTMNNDEATIAAVDNDLVFDADCCLLNDTTLDSHNNHSSDDSDDDNDNDDECDNEMYDYDNERGDFDYNYDDDDDDDDDYNNEEINGYSFRKFQQRRKKKLQFDNNSAANRHGFNEIKGFMQKIELNRKYSVNSDFWSPVVQTIVRHCVIVNLINLNFGRCYARNMKSILDMFDEYVKSI